MPLWILYALFSALGAAGVAIFAKIGISQVDTTLATTVRAIIMAIFLVILSGALGKFSQLHSINQKAFLFILLSGFAGAFSWMFYFMALKAGPAAGVVALDRLSVVFVLVLAAIFLSENLTIKSSIGAMLVTLGAILLAIK
ncbi:MAG TPA: EamA family transporter [Gammaproteobacteria bacterium]|nr:EamA family transporter [Gammaproteobacteria bacterium]